VLCLQQRAAKLGLPGRPRFAAAGEENGDGLPLSVAEATVWRGITPRNDARPSIRAPVVSIFVRISGRCPSAGRPARRRGRIWEPDRWFTTPMTAIFCVARRPGTKGGRRWRRSALAIRPHGEPPALCDRFCCSIQIAARLAAAAQRQLTSPPRPAHVECDRSLTKGRIISDN